MAAALQALVLGVDSADADQERTVLVHYATGRIVELRDKLSAREGRPGFQRNARHIRGEIARLEVAQQTQSATAEQEASRGQA